MEIKRLESLLEWCEEYMKEFNKTEGFDPYAKWMNIESKEQKMFCECADFVSDIGMYLGRRCEEFSALRNKILFGSGE